MVEDNTLLTKEEGTINKPTPINRNGQAANRALVIRALFSHVHSCMVRNLGMLETSRTLFLIHQLREAQGLKPMTDDDVYEYVKHLWG